jgi:hypothetical protein
MLALRHEERRCFGAMLGDEKDKQMLAVKIHKAQMP